MVCRLPMVSAAATAAHTLGPLCVTLDRDVLLSIVLLWDVLVCGAKAAALPWPVLCYTAS